MIFDKCARCGCFFTTGDSVCPNCKQKDEKDMYTLRNFLSNNEMPNSPETLALKAGVNIKNLNRFMQMESFQDVNQIITGQKIEKKIEL